MAQAPAELLSWLSDFGFPAATVRAVAALRFEEVPTLAATQANFAALQQTLRMSDKQARLGLCLPHVCLSTNAPTTCASQLQSDSSA